ncbi:MAG: tetratricopeptide repeat protein [Solirubrobacteraceae bacterium]
MSRRRDLVAVIAACCLAVGGTTAEAASPGAAASGSSTGAAPQQLTNAYPLGPQRLCCTGQSGAGQTGTGQSASEQPATRPSVASPPTRPARQPATGGGTSGASAVLFIGLGLAAALLVAGVAAVHRTRRRPVPLLAKESWAQPRATQSNGAVASAGFTDHEASGVGPFLYRSHAPPAAATEAEEVEYRRLDEDGDAGGAFNLGVVLHQRGDLAGAIAAYERAEHRGDLDAAFNLGVLLYEADDLEGALAAWRRSAARGHVRATANLVFLSRRRNDPDRSEPDDGDAGRGSDTARLADLEELAHRRADESGAGTGSFNLGVMLHQQGDVVGAIAAYKRAEQRGDPDAAFNLGVILYESGNLDGAEASWRRSVQGGHTLAAANLEFLLRRRHELEMAGLAGEAGDQR